jgi:ComF family protein
MRLLLENLKCRAMKSGFAEISIQIGMVVTERRVCRHWLREIGELIFPPSCVICNSMGRDVTDGICPLCLAKVSYVGSPMCLECGRNFSVVSANDHICGECLRSSPPFSLVRSIAFYEEPVRSLLHRLKYNFDTTVIDPLLKIAGNYDFSCFNTSDFIVPVPLHSQKLRWRGFNHAHYLAKVVFPERHQDILVDTLLKQRKTVSQTALSATKRRANLRAAFSVKDPNIIKNKRICVVDDVYTTGTTVWECAKALRGAGASDVVGVTIARVREK